MHSFCLEQFNHFLLKWYNNVCWMSDLLFKTHWCVTYITMSIYCPMPSYLHNTLLHKRHHDSSYLFSPCEHRSSSLVSNSWLNVTNRPVFRYFTHLGPRNFCAPPLPPYLFVFNYVQLSFQVQLISSTIPTFPLGKWSSCFSTSKHTNHIFKIQMHGLRWQPIRNSLSSF